MSIYDDTFRFNGRDYRYFWTHYNCGNALGRRSERTVELPLADRWLSLISPVWEVGAVSPYYWPGRVAETIDPYDEHPYATQRLSMFQYDLTGRNVLSISTIEHIGSGQYSGAPEDETPLGALAKIITEAERCLITFGVNYPNPKARELDAAIFNEQVQGVSVRFLVRNVNETWCEVPLKMAYRVFGDGGPMEVDWANSVCIVEKGGLL